MFTIKFIIDISPQLAVSLDSLLMALTRLGADRVTPEDIIALKDLKARIDALDQPSK